jgi:hypothetical protein
MPELPPPPDADQNPQAIEVLRAWIIDSALHCVLQSDTFEEAGPWGEVLADVVEHLARAREQLDGSPPAETIRAIRDVFSQEVAALLKEASGAGAEPTAPPAIDSQPPAP